MSKVMVIGTGTIGEPLTAILASNKADLGIDEVIVTKHSAREEDRPMVKYLQEKGVKLAVEEDKKNEFKDIGLKADMTVEEARQQADVIADCTPKTIGLENKEKYYNKLVAKGSLKFAVAQGSEFGFGKPYAYGVNDDALKVGEDKFVQIVSCNTHNLAVALQLIAGSKLENLVEADFTCIRRAGDVSQRGKGILSTKLDKHKDEKFGTHHAKDVYYLFETLDLKPNVFSSALIVPTQMMHAIRYKIRVKGKLTKEEIIERCHQDERVAVTNKDLAAQVFSFGRDHSKAHGRLLNPAVVHLPSLMVIDRDGNSEVNGFCFTPQDGNSIISSIAAISWGLDPKNYLEKMKSIREYMFEEV